MLWSTVYKRKLLTTPYWSWRITNQTFRPKKGFISIREYRRYLILKMWWTRPGMYNRKDLQCSRCVVGLKAVELLFWSWKECIIWTLIKLFKWLKEKEKQCRWKEVQETELNGSNYKKIWGSNTKGKRPIGITNQGFNGLQRGIKILTSFMLTLYKEGEGITLISRLMIKVWNAQQVSK